MWSSRPLPWLPIAAALAACSGSVTDGETCVPLKDNGSPDTPTLLQPAATGPIAADAVVLAGSAFRDPDDGQIHAASDFEIWSFDGGEPVARVWRARIDDPALLVRVTLADGAFAAGPGIAALSEWQDYGARVRYRDSSFRCSGWSAWSEWRRFRTDDASAYLFDDGQIRDVYVELPPDSFAAIDAEALPPDCVPYLRDYHPGTVRFEGQVFEGAGVRAKGGCGSARDLGGKAGFKLNLSWDDPAVPGCPTERRLYAEQRLTLNNMVQDPSFVHERLAYALHRAMGVPVPRVAHIRVHVNGELWGLYLHQETIDRRFLRRWFDSNRGMLYEGTYWCDLIDDNLPVGLDDTGCLSRKFKGGACSPPEPGDDPTDYRLLQELIDRIDALPDGDFYPEVEAFFDMDTLLSSWSVDAVIGHWDSYEFEIINNYRVYHDPSTDRWTIIPTGVDQTFVRDDFGAWAVEGRLARGCLDDPDCEAAFAARLAQALDVFEQLDLSARAAEIQQQIADDVAADPRKEHGYDRFVNRVQQTRAWIDARPAAVRQMLAAHGF